MKLKPYTIATIAVKDEMIILVILYDYVYNYSDFVMHCNRPCEMRVVLIVYDVIGHVSRMCGTIRIIITNGVCYNYTTYTMFNLRSYNDSYSPTHTCLF